MKYLLLLLLVGCTGHSDITASTCDDDCEATRKIAMTTKQINEQREQMRKTMEEMEEKICYIAGQRNVPDACPAVAKIQAVP